MLGKFAGRNIARINRNNVDILIALDLFLPFL